MRTRLTHWLTASAAAALLLSPALPAQASAGQAVHKKASRHKTAAARLHAHHSQGQRASGASTSVQAERPGTVQASTAIQAGEGRISYYHARFTGRRTANGERFDPSALTMAHRALPMGTLVRVTNLKNLRSVVLRVNDRGPWVHGRIADVTHAAAEKLDFLRSGLAKVRLEVVGREAGRRGAALAPGRTGTPPEPGALSEPLPQTGHPTEGLPTPPATEPLSS